MKIGTWNLDGKWTERHREFLAQQECDVWLLTEVPSDPAGILADFHCERSIGTMSLGQSYAAILSNSPLVPVQCGHMASVAASKDDLLLCATVLPWKSCKTQPNSGWTGKTLEEMAQPAIDALSKLFKNNTCVWGGDWNQNLYGKWQYVGSSRMRKLIETTLSNHGLVVPTAQLPHQIETLNTIDQIAVPSEWQVKNEKRIDARGLSDHDAYSLEAIIL